MGVDSGIGMRTPRPTVRRSTATAVAPGGSNPVYGAPIARRSDPMYGSQIGAAPVAYAKPKPKPFDIGPLQAYSDKLRAGGNTGGNAGGNTGGSTGGTGGDTGGDTNGDGEVTAEDQTDMGDDTLNATLAAIEAEFGMTKQQLLNDQGEAGRQYRQILAGMQMQRRYDLEAVKDDLVQRGILRSGETLENETKLQRGYAANVSAAQGDRDRALADAAAQLAALDPQMAARKATATSDHERAIRDYEAMKAMAGGGL